MKLTGENRSTRGKTCPSATLSTTNPTWTEVGGLGIIVKSTFWPGGGGCCNGNRNPFYNFPGVSQSVYSLGYALDHRDSISGGGLDLSRRHDIDTSSGLSLRSLLFVPGRYRTDSEAHGVEPDHLRIMRSLRIRGAMPSPPNT
jgi:hypothetical protein